MANPEHLEWLHEGVEAWNTRWQALHAKEGGRGPNLSEDELFMLRLGQANITKADLSGADPSGADLADASLFGANLREANLDNADLRKANLMFAHIEKANLREAILVEANLTGAYLSGAHLDHAYMANANLEYAHLREADLSEADLREANLREADLSGSDLREANLREANLADANLAGADLSKANLVRAMLVATDLRGANLTGSHIHGISAWNLQLEGTIQDNLVITRHDEPEVSVDNLEVAQFVYLLLNNPKIRDVIDTVAKKAVLILGNFGDEQMPVLEALRDALRLRGYVPILFNFEGPTSRDLTETVSALAHLARFVIADLTEPKSVPQELTTIVPVLFSVPVQPLIREGHRVYAMFEHFARADSVLPPYTYPNQEALIAALGERVIAPAEARAEALAPPPRDTAGRAGIEE